MLSNASSTGLLKRMAARISRWLISMIVGHILKGGAVCIACAF
jgi:hypothetical protein